MWINRQPVAGGEKACDPKIEPSWNRQILLCSYFWLWSISSFLSTRLDSQIRSLDWAHKLSLVRAGSCIKLNSSFTSRSSKKFLRHSCRSHWSILVTSSVDCRHLSMQLSILVSARRSVWLISADCCGRPSPPSLAVIVNSGPTSVLLSSFAQFGQHSLCCLYRHSSGSVIYPLQSRYCHLSTLVS